MSASLRDDALPYPDGGLWLFRYMPFSSRNGQPDWYIWRANNFTRVGGFFDADWEFDPNLAEVY